MIVVIENKDIVEFPRLLDDMHRLRRAVFAGRLDWDVHVQGRYEIDRFDFENPVYLISCDDVTGEVRGCARLLPTTGPNMLRDVFPFLLEDGQSFESTTIWESSRFSVDHRWMGKEYSQNRINLVTGELLLGLNELGQHVGLTSVVSVFDAMMLRVMRRAKCDFDVVAGPQKVGGVGTYVGLFPVCDEQRVSLADACGLHDPVLKFAHELDPRSFAINEAA